MPKWEPRLDKVLGVEEFVTRHAKATTGADWLMETDENRAMSVYLHYLANGTPIHVDTESPASKAAIERGKVARQSQGRRTEFCLYGLSRQSRRTTGSAANGWVSLRGSTIIFPLGAPACWRSGTSGSVSSGARSISAPTNCRPTPRNMAILNCISPRRTKGRSSACRASGTDAFHSGAAGLPFHGSCFRGPRSGTPRNDLE